MLTNSNFFLQWESYKSSISNGLSKLQQMQEFVDVTLAAGDHLVGAHQNILALASPYLKEMLKSAPCRHPVIFLGPISHTVLAFLLEYIYTGEVKIPSNILPSFVEASKMLHITGIKDVQVPEQFMDSNKCQTSRNESSTQNDESSGLLNNPTQMRINEKNQEDVLSLAEEVLQPPQEFIDLRSRAPEELTVQNTESIRPVEFITIDSEKLINVQTLAMENVHPAQEIDSQNEISDRPLDETTHFAACITIDNESHEVNVEPFINYENATAHEVVDLPIYQDSIPEDENKADNEDYEYYDMADFEDFIPSEIISTGPDLYTTSLAAEKQSKESENDSQKFIDMMSDKPTASGLLTITKLNDTPNTDKNKEDNCCEVSATIATALYLKSIRGNVMMIMNRFVYNLHHTSLKGSKRRWRCIDYRRKNCRAYVDTLNEDIVSRKEIHTHFFHDNKVLKLGRRQDFKSTIEKALKSTYYAIPDDKMEDEKS